MITTYCPNKLQIRNKYCINFIPLIKVNDQNIDILHLTFKKQNIFLFGVCLRNKMLHFGLFLNNNKKKNVKRNSSIVAAWHGACVLHQTKNDAAALYRQEKYNVPGVLLCGNALLTLCGGGPEAGRKTQHQTPKQGQAGPFHSRPHSWMCKKSTQSCK